MLSSDSRFKPGLFVQLRLYPLAYTHGFCQGSSRFRPVGLWSSWNFRFRHLGFLSRSDCWLIKIFLMSSFGSRFLHPCPVSAKDRQLCLGHLGFRQCCHLRRLNHLFSILLDTSVDHRIFLVQKHICLLSSLDSRYLVSNTGRRFLHACLISS